MGLMDDVSAITDKLAFCNADNMLGVESFTYWPKGGTPKTVSGPVTRDALELQAKYGIAIRAIVVFVSKQDVPHVNSPGDSIEIPFDLGDTAARHTVKQILQQDAGGFTLLIG